MDSKNYSSLYEMLEAFPTEEYGFPVCEYWHPDKQTAISEGKRVLKEWLSRGDKRDWYAGVHFDPFKIYEIREPNTVTRISTHDLS